MADRLTFLGHSTVLIDLDGVRVLTDPLLGHLAGGVIRRHVPTVHPDALEGLAAVFISHGHLDHLDLASLRALPGRPTLFVPAGLGRVVAAVARGAVHEMRVGDRLNIGALTLDPWRTAFLGTVLGYGLVFTVGGTIAYGLRDIDKLGGFHWLVNLGGLLP